MRTYQIAVSVNGVTSTIYENATDLHSPAFGTRHVPARVHAYKLLVYHRQRAFTASPPPPPPPAYGTRYAPAREQPYRVLFHDAESLRVLARAPPW